MTTDKAAFIARLAELETKIATLNTDLEAAYALRDSALESLELASAEIVRLRGLVPRPPIDESDPDRPSLAQVG